MSTSATRIARQSLAELRVLLYSRAALMVFGALLLGVVVAAAGSISHARATHDQFLERVAVFEENGISLADALEAPMTVSREDGAETIDNPLKYDYLQVGEAFAAIRPVGMVATALDLVTFVVAPLVFLMLGAWVATWDREARTSRLRASRERWSWVSAGKAVAIVVMAAGGVAVVALGGFLAGVVVLPASSAQVAAVAFPLATETGLSPLLPKLVFSVATCAFFGLVGHAVGLATRSRAWPMVIAAAFLFLVPFLSPWDPRNMLAVVGDRVFDFWGQFEVRPPIPLAVGSALLGLAAWALVALAVVAVRGRRPLLQ